MGMRMAVRLETLQVQISSRNNSVDMPIEQMYGKLENFNKAYDDLSIKRNILDDGMEKTLGEKGGYKNVDNMMNGLKAEVNLEMGITPDLDPTAMQEQQQNQANNDYYNDLRNM